MRRLVGILMCLVGSWIEMSHSAAVAADAIFTRSGHGNAVTDPFQVGNGWQLHWTFAGEFDHSFFQLFIHNDQGPSPDVPVDGSTHPGPGSGTMPEEEGGQCYLKILATGEWTVTVVPEAATEGARSGRPVPDGR